MSVLAKVTKGRVKKPHLVLIYGPDGVGKSSFGASAPNPIFLGSEDGTNEIDVNRLPPVESWIEIIQSLSDLINDPHDFKTLVIDSLDWIEPILNKHLCREHRVTSIEYVGGGYGKGYVEALNQWGAMQERLNLLRAKRNMNIILIAHSQVITFNDPNANASYDRYEMKLYKKASSLWREYVDTVFFANFETFAKKDGGKMRAYGDGARVMYSERRPAFDAKNRSGLPFILPLSWQDYQSAYDQPKKDDCTKVIAEITKLLESSNDEKFNEVVRETSAKAAANIVQLNAILNRLKIRLAEKEQANGEQNQAG